MGYNDIKRDRERFAETAGDAFSSGVRRLQFNMYRIIDDILAGLIVDKAGRLVFGLDNIRKGNQVGYNLTAFWRSEKRGFLSWVVGSLKKLFGLNTDYFREIVPVTETVEKSVLRRLLAVYGYDNEKGELIPGGWFEQLAPSDQIGRDIAGRINQAIAAKMPLNEFRRRFRADFINPGGLGYLERYYGRFSHDLFQQFDRGVQLAYAESLGLSNAIYSGTAMKDTRRFCIRRLNKVYNLQEINSWNGQTWKGKNPNIDVKLACGGYNCRHHFSWVTDELAGVLAERQGGINKYNP